MKQAHLLLQAGHGGTQAGNFSLTGFSGRLGRRTRVLCVLVGLCQSVHCSSNRGVADCHLVVGCLLNRRYLTEEAFAQRAEQVFANGLGLFEGMRAQSVQGRWRGWVEATRRSWGLGSECSQQIQQIFRADDLILNTRWQSVRANGCRPQASVGARLAGSPC